MANAIICVILVVIFIYGVKSYIKKIAYGCCNSGGDEVKKIKPKDKNILNYPFAFKIEISGMTCANCKRRVENAFNEKDGFYATVNLKQKDAIVRIKNKVSKDELKNIVQSQGYKVVSISEF